jgi:hypothetical protein
MLLKICQHLYLFESIKYKINLTGFIDENICRVSSKLSTCILLRFSFTGCRASILFQMTKVATTRSDNKVYDPFEVLSIGHGTPEKKYNVNTTTFCSNSTLTKLAVNQMLEESNKYFIQLTKVYKNLRDLEI